MFLDTITNADLINLSFSMGAAETFMNLIFIFMAAFLAALPVGKYLVWRKDLLDHKYLSLITEWGFEEGLAIDALAIATQSSTDCWVQNMEEMERLENEMGYLAEFFDNAQERYEEVAEENLYLQQLLINQGQLINHQVQEINRLNRLIKPINVQATYTGNIPFFRKAVNQALPEVDDDYMVH